MTDTINKYLLSSFSQQINKMLFIISCEHSFEEYGHGFKCPKCHYYTGTNKDLNNIIDKNTKKSLTND